MTRLEWGMRLRQNDLTWQVVSEEVVVLDLSGSIYLKVNGSGRTLWEALAEGSSEAELAARLAEQYGIDAEQASADVSAFLADLRGRGLVEE